MLRAAEVQAEDVLAFRVVSALQKKRTVEPSQLAGRLIGRTAAGLSWVGVAPGHEDTCDGRLSSFDGALDFCLKRGRLFITRPLPLAAYRQHKEYGNRE